MTHATDDHPHTCGECCARIAARATARSMLDDLGASDAITWLDMVRGELEAEIATERERLS